MTTMKEKVEGTAAVMNRALAFAFERSCPCAFPRLRYLWSFRHENYGAGAVGCFDTHILTDSFVQLLRQKYPQSVQLNKSGALEFISCPKCGSLYAFSYDQYSINFERYFLDCLEDKAPLCGAAVEFPFPLSLGLFGFERKNIDLCEAKFTLTQSLQNFESYLNALEAGSPP